LFPELPRPWYGKLARQFADRSPGELPLFLVVPTGTDAPIYHWPYVTVGLIVVNVALLFAIPPVASTPALNDDGEVIEGAEIISNFDRYSLAIGDGRLHPVQWVTHNFLHNGFMHLAGNMLFLWAFGIVVEGKLGPVKYLLAYLAIGALHGALVQTVFVRSGLDGHAAGASAVIYGLLAACMVWAPRNELNCLAILLVGLRTMVFHWDLYYTTVALIYIGEQVINLLIWGALGGKVMISELGHLSGAFWGTVVAVTLLKTRLVDCENWDLFSLWTKRRNLAKSWKKRVEQLDRQKENLRLAVKANTRAKLADRGAFAGPDGPALEERAAAAVRRVRSLIDAGDIAGAITAYEKSARTLFNWPPRADLYDMIKAMHAHGAEPDSIRLMRDHCRFYPGESGKVRLKLAQILIRDRQRPVAALRVLAEIPPGSLPPNLESARRTLTSKANQMRADGVLELEEDD
jgi:membrane associated rhomboid family serine protease